MSPVIILTGGGHIHFISTPTVSYISYHIEEVIILIVDDRIFIGKLALVDISCY